MTRLGADVEQLESLARSFDSARRDLGATARELSNRTSSVFWVGRDADDFRRRWSQASAPALRQLGQTLDDAATSLRRQAGEQRRASTHDSTAPPIDHGAAKRGSGDVHDAGQDESQPLVIRTEIYDSSGSVFAFGAGQEIRVDEISDGTFRLTMSADASVGVSSGLAISMPVQVEDLQYDLGLGAAELELAAGAEVHTTWTVGSQAELDRLMQQIADQYVLAMGYDHAPLPPPDEQGVTIGVSGDADVSMAGAEIDNSGAATIGFYWEADGDYGYRESFMVNGEIVGFAGLASYELGTEVVMDIAIDGDTGEVQNIVVDESVEMGDGRQEVTRVDYDSTDVDAPVQWYDLDGLPVDDRQSGIATETVDWAVGPQVVLPGAEFGFSMEHRSIDYQWGESPS
ncbi:MAG: hypothetical protein ACK5OX_05095 [Desertimonas sp.]